MTKVLVLYYSSYGHIEQMADAFAEGARAGGAEVDVRRVPETLPGDVAEKMHFKADTAHPVMDDVERLVDYDAIAVGTPTRFGRMPAQMATFWDQTGQLWQRGALIGKVGAAFTSTATQHGGNEMTLFSVIANLLHHGLTIVGLDGAFQGQFNNNEIVGGSPYGATTIASTDGSRQPHPEELAAARYQGERIARTAAKLAS